MDVKDQVCRGPIRVGDCEKSSAGAVRDEGLGRSPIVARKKDKLSFGSKPWRVLNVSDKGHPRSQTRHTQRYE